ncbi:MULTISPECIES: hypothetical protein [Pedobacter]|uniref:Outer membrane protein beta-barrel domain-containing protein n=1 Tax=Pedobacter heparinus (strain ATCC 13125 / DSM 2366 / CIP 104194 / JCM 7457 / NBRC 12017 / NCIMB 9290 / NRRL B-14731 / HIM 762-3) TaxID=485917 RepID=C6Y3Z0_PEDHD|nr:MULTISPECIES: hypothetical protein [Pedobacter]ACU05433.1 hypothetical protein Phep_3238 [Pedobacter heparinus DSM 2366]MBB5439416.1 hypothetical protein [Pedobacter sp. AK017]
MKKILSIAIACFFTWNYSLAQTNGNESKIGLGLEAAFPVGNFKDIADYGIGVSLLYQKPVAKNLIITGNVGYIRFQGPAVFSNIKYKQGFVPIKAGARYFIIPHVYVAGELGISISTANGYGSGTSFTYAPGLGAEFPVSGTGTIDIGLRYESWSRSTGTLSFPGLRAGYNF